MAKLFGRLNNLSYRGGETETANVVIDGGVIKVDVTGSPQDVTGAYIIGSTLYIKRASADTLELPLLQPNLAETDTNSLAFVKNKKISYLENDTGYITAKDADKTYIKKVTVNGTDVPILSDGQVAQILIGEGLSVGADAIISVNTSKIATNKYVDDEINAVSEDITNHKDNQNNPHNVTKAQVCLGNVDNTSDIDKPVSTLQQEALDKKVDKVEGKGLSTEDFTTELKNKLDGVENGAQVNTITGVKGDAESGYRAGNVNITKENIGLENVNNTSDEDKPISIAQQNALDAKLDIAGGSITGNLSVQGDLIVSGTTTTEHQKQLLVEDNVIVTNANKIDLQALLSGIAINKNSSATYGIMYDPSDDTIKFGIGTLDDNNKFTFNTDKELPIAIRAQASDFTDAHLVKWDATKNAFIDAGYSSDNFAQKSHTHLVTAAGTNSSTSLTPEGTISTPTFTGIQDSHTHTFTGNTTSHNHSFTGTEAEITSTFIPEGNVSSSFTGVAHNHTFTGNTHTHTFTGSAVTSDKPDATNITTIYSITDVGSLPSASLSSGTLPSHTYTAPSHTYTAPSLTASVSNQCLTLTWSAGTHIFNAGSHNFSSGSFPTLTFDAGSLPTRSSAISMPNTNHTHTVTADGIIGSAIATGSISNTTATGSVSSSFTGLEGEISATYTPGGTIGDKSITPAGTIAETKITPAGTVSQPIFNGTAISHTHTFTGSAVVSASES